VKPLSLICLTLAAATVSCGALAVQCDLAEVAIVDRDTGTTLGTHYYHGEYWVAGRPGARYAVQVRNRTEGRLLAVTSVDGINVISGATAAYTQAGYVFAPKERYDIDGWRKSNAEVADFTFASAPNSYAERTGRPANVGVIGVALFRERRPAPAYVAPGFAPPDNPREERLQEAPSAAAPDSSAGMADSARSYHPREPLPGSKLGTGHGEREASFVRDTEFLRMQDAPDAIIRIRYDSIENLVAMGIVPRDHAPGLYPNPFPDSSEPRYVPDPPG
jgi:hypothetical protein